MIGKKGKVKSQDKTYIDPYMDSYDSISLIGITYNAQTRKYELQVKVENIEEEYTGILIYGTSLNILIDKKKRRKIKKEIKTKYNKVNVESVDLNLYQTLKFFDEEYHSNYASKYINQELPIKPVYNFKKEKPYRYMKFFANLKANYCIHHTAKKQKRYANATIIKKRSKMKIIAILSSLIIGSLAAKQYKNIESGLKGNTTQITTMKSGKENKIQKKTKIIKENLESSFKTTIQKTTANTQHIMAETMAVKAAATPAAVSVEANIEKVKKKTIKDLVDAGEIVPTEINGFGLADKIDLSDHKLSNEISKKFGNMKYTDCDKLDYDYYVISEIVAYRNDEILDVINLKTKEKYNKKTNELYKEFGPKIEIALGLCGYKDEKQSKNLGYINIDEITRITEEQKEEIANPKEKQKSYVLKRETNRNINSQM